MNDYGYSIVQLRFGRCCAYCGVYMQAHTEIARVPGEQWDALAHIECAKKRLKIKPETSDWAKAYAVTDGERHDAAARAAVDFLKLRGFSLGRP